MAEEPNRLEKIFLNVENTDQRKLNRNGLYAVDLYALGVKHTVIIDDFLPLQHITDKYGKESFETLFSHVADD